MSPVTQAIIDYKSKNPNANNQEIAEFVCRTVPGASTSAASVSSVLSRLKNGTGSLSQASARGHAPTSFLLANLPPDLPEETDEEAATRITVRYSAYARHSRKVILKGGTAGLICSGPPGLGKSYQVRRDLEESGRTNFVEIEARQGFGDDPIEYCKSAGISGVYDSISGSITAVGLYQALWYMRKGGVLVLDDCDAVFHDPDALNLLKAALDTELDHRRISWRKEARWLEDYGIARSFLFQGSVIFLTNIDFEGVIARGTKDAEHFKALIDRSNYLCLTLRSERDFMIRIRQVAGGTGGMIEKQFGLPPEHGDKVLDWIDCNRHKFYNLSLRLVGQVCDVYKDACVWETEYVPMFGGEPYWKPEDPLRDATLDEDGEPTGNRRIASVDDNEWQEDVIATKTRTY